MTHDADRKHDAAGTHDPGTAAAAREPISLSVVIPCYNAEATLGEQLGAVAEQSWPGEWEVVVADNGSTDGSRQVAESFRGRLPSLSVVDASGRGGPGHSRNVGAAHARGDALVFCDADDVVAPGWLRAMGEALTEHALVSARYDADRLNPPAVVEARGRHQTEGVNPYTYPPYLPHAGGGGLGVHRRLHRQIGGFDEDLPALEDTDYCWRLQLAGEELVPVPDALVHIRYRPDLRGHFRQTARFGEYNVLLYKRYRERGMPRLSPLVGLAKWARLALTSPQLLTASGRGRWLGQLAWRWGRLVGCVKHRVPAL